MRKITNITQHQIGTAVTLNVNPMQLFITGLKSVISATLSKLKGT